GLEPVSIRRIQGIGYGILEFLRVGTTFDIFQNIHMLYIQYVVLVFTGYGVLIMFPLWSLVSAGTDTSYLPFGYGVLVVHSTEFQLPLAYTIASFPCDKLHPLPVLVYDIPLLHAQIPCSYNIESHIVAVGTNYKRLCVVSAARHIRFC
ncbi:hypothetical protein Tco_1097720, partial [Tanacetum coccineum]